MRKPLTQETFIQKAIEVHGDKYNYSKVKYKDSQTKIIITCDKHGDFEQSPNKHLCNRGCPVCGLENRTTTKEEFIEKAKAIHRDKYIYENINYLNTINYINILCPIHGEFKQIGYEHLRGRGCPSCANVKPLTIEQFIEKAKAIHSDKYDYSKVNYINIITPIIIICPIHGEFEQKPLVHLRNSGCSKCMNVYNYTTEEFIEKAIAIHGKKYDYSKVNYINNYTHVIIICKKHGIFNQQPREHLYRKCGCPVCASSKGELAIKTILDKYNIEAKPQYMMPEVADILKYDFYLPEYRLLIEFHGIQHYEYSPYFHGENDNKFLKQKERDDVVRYNARRWKYNYLEFNYKQFEFMTKEQFEELVISKINGYKKI